MCDKAEICERVVDLTSYKSERFVLGFLCITHFALGSFVSLTRQKLYGYTL